MALGISMLLLLPAPGPMAQPVALSDAEPEPSGQEGDEAEIVADARTVNPDSENSENIPDEPDEPDEPAPSGRSFLATLTAYSYESCAANPCRTRTGTVPAWGTVAVDPSVIPLGSRLLIEQYPGVTFTALDTGGGVRGQHVDLWMNSTRGALNFGRRRGLVTVLE